MVISWFLQAVGMVYGVLLLIVVAWLAQRAAKSLRPGAVRGGDVAIWSASIIGALLGCVSAMVAVRHLTVALPLIPITLLGGLWLGSVIACYLLRLMFLAPPHRTPGHRTSMYEE